MWQRGRALASQILNEVRVGTEQKNPFEWASGRLTLVCARGFGMCGEEIFSYANTWLKGAEFHSEFFSACSHKQKAHWRAVRLFYFDNVFFFFLSPVGKWALNCDDENRYLSRKVLNTWHTHTQMHSMTQTQMLHTNWETAVPRSLHHGITQSLRCGRISNICSPSAKFAKQLLIILFSFYSFLFIPPTQKLTRK